ncbi:hypothetical protein BGZ60DRAFT_418223 [Tricladium varicosporioides]|nr:hypothetical protein BGZ60DRAFT_418223 [Hymenoscyphus varicosporioides]
MSQISKTFAAAKVEDAFDSVDWDPDLPSATAPDSPEPITVKPTPVAYTTVGSLVDPTAKPQFSAPNRIQREGAARQPLMTMLQRGQYDSFYQARGPPPPLNMANSMAYAQQIAKSPSSASSASQQAPRTLRTTPAKTMTEAQEKEQGILRRMRRITEPQMVSGNAVAVPNTPTPNPINRLPIVASTFGSKQPVVHVQDISQSSGSNENLESVSKHEIHSTLGKFENAFFKLKSTHAPPRVASFDAPQISRSTNNAQNNQSRGELDRAYQFPPPGFSAPQPAQVNPLFGALNASISRPMLPHAPPPGLPQPLTAGPPGQRQYPSAVGRSGMANLQSIWTGDQSSAYSANTNAPTTDCTPFQNYSTQELSFQAQAQGKNLYTRSQTQLPQGFLAPPPSVPNWANGETARIVDTLPPEAIKQYYPNGLPNDMAGAYTPLSVEKQKQMDEISLNVVQKRVESGKGIDEWFYSGQRRYATMEGEDFVNELERRHASPWGAIAPPKKTIGTGPIISKPINKKEMENMTIGEAARPLLEAAFGSMLAYAATGSDSRKTMSGFVPAPKWQLDESEKGDQSLFGEDWGAPPKRFGRDSRRQDAFFQSGF